MTAPPISSVLAALLKEDEELKEQEERIRRRRAQLSSAVTSLTALENDQMPEYQGGLAEAIRNVLRADPEALFTPSDVRTGLKILKFNFDNLSNPLASIHSVLKRLFESGDAERVETAEGTCYRWPRSGAGLKRLIRESIERRLALGGPPPQHSESLASLRRDRNKPEVGQPPPGAGEIGRKK